jgi:hypothetical protein
MNVSELDGLGPEKKERARKSWLAAINFLILLLFLWSGRNHTKYNILGPDQLEKEKKGS